MSKKEKKKRKQPELQGWKKKKKKRSYDVQGKEKKQVVAVRRPKESDVRVRESE